MSRRGRIVSARRRVSLIKTRSLHRHLFLCTESSHPLFAQHGNKIMSGSIYVYNLLSLFLPPPFSPSLNNKVHQLTLLAAGTP